MRRKKINLKAIVCALMSSAMILTLVTPASAATARATTMKLEKTEGTVTLKTQNGSTRKITKGMRLYNGNTLSTAKYSYAHISLDSTKAVKLDQSSSATLRQSGKQLELLVKSGKLFFNVSKKLSAKESMNVRTSTMVTGVRGTCGVVEFVSSKQSKLYLIEGQVTLGTGSNATVVQGGQVATVILQDKPATSEPGKPDKGDQNVIAVEKLPEKNIPPVALQEIVADPVLQEKIEKTTELKIEKIEEALEQFEKEEAERIEQEKAEQEKDEEKDQEKEQDEKKEDESTSSSGDGSYTPGTPAPTSATLYGTVSAAAINVALKSYSKVTVAASGTDTGDAAGNTTTITLEENVTIPQNKVLLIETGEVSGSGQISVGSGTLIDTVGTASGAISDSNARLCTVNDTSVYASGLNAQVADYLNQQVQTSSVHADFSKPVSVTANVSLSGSSSPITLAMGMNTLTIGSGGTLTLGGNVGVSGESEKPLIQLNGGNLVMQGTSTSAEAKIENSGTGYAIAQTNGGTVTWNDTGLSVSAKNTAINGAEVSDEIVILPDWVKTSYVAACQNNKITLQSVPAKFTSGTVSAADLNKSLSVYQTVTVGPDAKANLSAADTVTVPAGKTLNIASKVTQVGTNQYSGGFYLGKSTLFKLEDRAVLNVNGNGFFGGNGIISAGSGATILVNSDCTLHADEIKLAGNSSIANSGLIDGGKITSAGNATITNNMLIKLKYAYTTSGSTDTYTPTDASALITGESSTALPEGNLLACNSDKTQYCYANKLNSVVASYMDIDAWTFSKDALVPSDANITLTDFHADMGPSVLQIAGTLTLSGSAIVTGEGDATVRLSGGTINLGKSGTDSTYAEIKNTSTAGYAIEYGSGTLNWNNKKFHIIAEGGFEKTLSGTGLSNDNTTNYVTVPSYVKVSDGKINWNETRKELRYVPADFLNTSETVEKGQIVWSLGANSVMTIGKGVPAQLTKEDKVTISQGKTLKIQTDNFSMAAGSYITIEAGGTLIVEGKITGNGTIDVSASGAKLEVVAADGIDSTIYIL